MAKLSATEISQVLAGVPGCQNADCGECLKCRVRLTLMGRPPAEGHAITIGSLLSARTKQGLIEFVVNDERLQFPIDKAREIYEMFGGAIEAATTDQIVYEIMRDKGLPEAAVLAILAEMREKRQGSKGTVHAS